MKQAHVGDRHWLPSFFLNSPAYQERVGERRDVRGTCWIDPLIEPPAISIYRLEGKTLTVCLAYPGHPRPTAFLSQPDVQQVRVYRRD